MPNREKPILSPGRRLRPEPGVAALFLAGVLAGWMLGDLWSEYAERPATDRRTFRYLEWQIDDFEREFTRAYQELCGPLHDHLLQLIGDNREAQIPVFFVVGRGGLVAKGW
jgi:hypothetical protein